MEGETKAPTPFKGQCFCSSVRFEMAGDVKALVHTMCHCVSCQRYHAAASAACMLFPIKIEDGKFSDSRGKFKVVQGENKIKLYRHSPSSITRRFFCQDCGAPVFNSIPDMGVVNTFPSCFGGEITFKPTFHSNYADKLFPVQDGLPKYKGFVGSELLNDDGQLIPTDPPKV